MAALWVVSTFAIAILFVFQNGVVFALTFAGICWLPCLAVATCKWAIMRGDRQQKVVIPLISMFIAFGAYWLSPNVNLHIAGHLVTGFALWVVAAIIGLTVPAWMAER